MTCGKLIHRLCKEKSLAPFCHPQRPLFIHSVIAGGDAPQSRQRP